MIKTRTFVFLLICLTFFSLSAKCQSLLLEQINSDGIYKAGEKIDYYLITNGKTVDTVSITIIKNNKVEVEKKKIIVDSERSSFTAALSILPAQ
ncbi:MAG: hypothetical protein IPN68_07750 [Bacteroidetes bacterium]|nr:hypothetical protein [Bacteroidota bacterium]